jgi:hypothetical protein
MTYELAKQLKDAGFVVGDFGGVRCIHTGDKYPRMTASITCSDASGQQDGTHCERVYFPTLYELIEACSDDFYSLWRSQTGEWRAAKSDDEPNFSNGSTPEEAVARLWLSLHSPK